jgi:hypothetical protein
MNVRVKCYFFSVLKDTNVLLTAVYSTPRYHMHTVQQKQRVCFMRFVINVFIAIYLYSGK